MHPCQIKISGEVVMSRFSLCGTPV